MPEIDTATISLIVNALLGIATIYLAPHFVKLRKLRNLNQTLIDALDDHSVDEEETQDIIDQIKDLM